MQLEAWRSYCYDCEMMNWISGEPDLGERAGFSSDEHGSGDCSATAELWENLFQEYADKSNSLKDGQAERQTVRKTDG